MINTEFLLTSLAVVLIPGAGVIYTITTGLTQKWRAGIAAAVGSTLGILPHIAASILGLSAILHMSAQVFSILKYAGAAYLLYLAWNMWREAGTLEIESKDSESSTLKIIFKAITINLLNPKLTIFFFTFLPMFISEDSASTTSEMISLSVVFMLMTLVVFILYGLLASAISARLMRSSKAVKRFQQASVLVLAAFAVKLALSEK